jgi:hypothetical protein
MLQRFMLFYNGFESRPVFATVEEMLKWTGLYGLTRRTLEEELLDAGLSSQTIAELVTVCSVLLLLSSVLPQHVCTLINSLPGDHKDQLRPKHTHKWPGWRRVFGWVRVRTMGRQRRKLAASCRIAEGL